MSKTINMDQRTQDTNAFDIEMDKVIQNQKSEN